MSDNITKEARLTALVLSAPVERKHKYLHYCALLRAQESADDKTRCLIEFARTLGFSRDEAVGIMTGWDLAAGVAPAFEGWSEDYRLGEALGARLHALVHGTKEVS